MLTASALAAASLGTAGCATLNAASAAARVPPDVTLLHAVITAKTTMIGRYMATAAAHPQLRAGLGPLLGDHQAHLAELQHRLVEPPHPAPGLGPPKPAASAAPPVPSGAGAAVAALASAERAASAQHVAQLRSVTASLAQLLASIAACEATHVTALAAL